MSSTQFLSDEDVQSVFNWTDAVAALRAAYSMASEGAAFPPRAIARGTDVWLRTMTGVLGQGRYMGSKHIAAALPARKVSYLITLFDKKTAALAALIDASFITGARTAATSALVADSLCKAGPLKVAVLGSGFEARMHLRALAAMNRVDSVAIYSPTAARRNQLADELAAQLGLKANAEDSAEHIVSKADLVVCAARSRDETPILLGKWLGDKAVVVSIGSTVPEQREVDSEVVARADLVIADMPEEVSHDTGDMIAARADGIEFASKIHSIPDLLQGRVSVAKARSGIRLYKSVGAGLQDLAVAVMCLERAQSLGLARSLPFSIEPVQK